MQFISTCPLNPSGALLLLAGEVTIGSAAGVTLTPEDDQTRSRYNNGTLYVTTHRIVWVNGPSRDTANIFLAPLGASTDPVQDKSHKFRGLHRLRLGLGSGIKIDFVTRNGSADKERMQDYIAQALAKKEWAKVATPSEPIGSRQPGTAGAPPLRGMHGTAPAQPSVAPQLRGIHGIVTGQRAAADERGAHIQQGFASLESLMQSADKLVQIASRFRTLNPDTKDEDELLNMIAEMGIESPVTKAATGNNTRLYRMDLARQMSDFLTKVAIRVGGVITIADAYCSYNRARATTELVSPEDFNSALSLLHRPEINSKLELFTLQSGVRALRLDVSQETGGANALATLAEERSCLTALDIVQERGIPLQVALNMLESAERSGYLARDDTTDGVRFFPNRFQSLSCPSISSAS